MTKKILSAVVAVLMALAIMPVAAIAAPVTEEAALAVLDRAWETIDAVEAEAVSMKATPEEVTLAAYEAAERSDRVTDLTWEGSRQFAFKVDGMHCVYVYRLQNEIERYEGTYQESQQFIDGTNGNAPSSANVLLVAPYYGIDGSFTDQYKNEAQSIAATTGGSYTLLERYEATGPAIAAAYADKGVVIYDSHGTQSGNSSYLCLTTDEGITQSDYTNGYAVYAGGEAYIDGRYINAHKSEELSNCMVWMAICEGMMASGQGTTGRALLDAGAAVVYGYSQSVTFAGEYMYEEVFWNEMKNGATVAEAIAVMKDEHGIPDPYGDAYPIVMSPTDPFPANPDGPQTVTSDWKLIDDEPVIVTGVALTPESTDLYINNTFTFDYVTTPENANNYTVDWSTEDTDIISVDKGTGLVTALAAGEATVKITVTNNYEGEATRSGETYTAEATVNVLGTQALTGIGVTPEAAEIFVGGEALQLTPVFTPANASNQNVTWESSDDTIATVDENGLVTAVASGEATITVTSEEGGFTAQAAITVVSIGDVLNIEGGELVFDVTGEYPWVVTEEDGRECAMSSNQGYSNTTSSISTTVSLEAGDVFMFEYKISCEDGYDAMLFTVNGGMAERFSGKVNQWELVTYTVAQAGEYTFGWDYIKDVSVNGGEDTAWLDNVGVVEAGTMCNVTFTAGEGGTLIGETAIEVPFGTVLTTDDVPAVEVNEGFVAAGWTPYNPVGATIVSDVDFEISFIDIGDGITQVILTAGDVWNDGSGYQMLLDIGATAYGTIIPETGALTAAGQAADPSIYAEFEYKIPENADGALNTSNIVLNDSVAILIPAGVYDWCITNPTPGDRVWIASSNNPNCPGRYDDFIFEADKTYEFTVTLSGENDWVELEISDGIEEPTPPPTDPVPTDPLPSNPPASGALVGWYFEEQEEIDEWTFIDDDGDGFNWTWTLDYYNAFVSCEPYEGEGCLYSESYFNPTWEPLTPDNWAVSPEFEIPENAANVTLSYYVAPQDANYPADHYAVYAVVDGQEELLYEETLTSSMYGYVNRTVDLSAYAGETVSIAFRHFNSYDMFCVKIDQVEIFAEEAQIHTVNFIDDLTGEIIATYEVEHGDSVEGPAAPEHEGYEFVGWRIAMKGTNVSLENVICDMDCYAMYEAIYHTVTFVDGMTEEVIATQDVQETMFAEAPEAPAHDGYTFIGWTVDGEFVNVEAYPVMGEVTFVAEYSRNLYYVFFNTNLDANYFATFEVEEGESFTEFPEAPVVEGYVFTGDYEVTLLGGESHVAPMSGVHNITENILVTYIYEEAAPVEPNDPPKTGAMSMTAIAVTAIVSGLGAIALRKKED